MSISGTSFSVTALTALEILDSRGNPTLQVDVTLGSGSVGRAGVPSGASTGSREAVELRDGDPERYGGKGVLTAVGNVNGELRDLARSRAWSSLADLDQGMISADGTSNKGRLGANAIVGVSMAVARALAGSEPLFTALQPTGVTPRMPVPHFNVLNGGAHAPNSLDFQEFMIAPIGAPSMPEAVRAGAAVYAKLRGLLQKAGFATGLGDEGGFAPDITRPEDVLALLVQAIEAAGYPTGRTGVAIAERLGDTTQIVGDDIFVTNPAIITEAIGRKVGNSALIKLNQIGSVSETLEAMHLCRKAGYTQMVSHRSGETDDSFIADLTVGTGCGQLKSGAPARGERVAKYNRLLEIDATTDLAYRLT